MAWEKSYVDFLTSIHTYSDFLNLQCLFIFNCNMFHQSLITSDGLFSILNDFETIILPDIQYTAGIAQLVECRIYDQMVERSEGHRFESRQGQSNLAPATWVPLMWEGEGVPSLIQQEHRLLQKWRVPPSHQVPLQLNGVTCKRELE